MHKYITPLVEELGFIEHRVICASTTDEEADGLLYGMGIEDMSEGYGFKAR